MKIDSSCFMNYFDVYSPTWPTSSELYAFLINSKHIDEGVKQEDDHEVIAVIVSEIRITNLSLVLATVNWGEYVF
jgi:hypothetical protein